MGLVPTTTTPTSADLPARSRFDSLLVDDIPASLELILSAFMEAHSNHILYIEDHDDTRELVTLLFRGLNFRITTSSSVAEALKLAAAHNFDLYLLDSWLPDGSGIELCQRLRKIDQRTPIMFLSAAAFEVDKQTALANGAQRYLVKPVDLDLLCAEVGALLDDFSNQEELVEEQPRSIRVSPSQEGKTPMEALAVSFI